MTDRRDEDQKGRQRNDATGERESHSREAFWPSLVWITEELDLNGFVSEGELSKHTHSLVDGVSTGVVVVEEISGEEDEVDLQKEEGGRRRRGELRARTEERVS